MVGRLIDESVFGVVQLYLVPGHRSTAGRFEVGREFFEDGMHSRPVRCVFGIRSVG
jgi:hypothetical protein